MASEQAKSRALAKTSAKASTEAPLDVSVVVLGYNTKDYLSDCFNSILAQTGAKFETLYVDNASADGSAEFVKNNFKAVRVISSPSNTGYAGGNNFGAASARGEYLLIVNPDIIAQAGWLSKLLQFARQKEREGEDVIACSKVVLADKPDTINSLGLFMSSLGFSGSVGDGEKSEKYTQPIEMFAPTGCSFLIRRETFLSLGGFDESFFMYDEDLDLGWRAANRGIATWMAPSSVIWHKYKKFSGRAAPYYQTARNRLWAVRKNERGIRMFMLAVTCKLFNSVLALGMLLKLKPGISLALFRANWSGCFSPVKKDEMAGGPAGKKILGFGVTMPIFFKKLAKHSK